MAGAPRSSSTCETGDGELIELDVTGTTQRTASKLSLALSVRSSTVAGCAVGSRGTLTLVNGPVDEVVVGVCGRSSRYRAGGDNNVRVTLTRP